MNTTNCLNCGNALAAGMPFCAKCGQKGAVHRFTMKHFFHELFHAFTHTDKGLLHLVVKLATAPGQTARNYLFGKRKSYFNPFTFFLILMGLFVVSNNYFKPPLKKVQPDPHVMHLISSADARDKYLATLSRVNKASTAFKTHGNIVAMIAVPFISLFSWLFFKRRGLNYAEHLTANMMFVALSNLVFTLIIFPAQSLFKGVTPMLGVLAVGMLLQVIYFAWSYNGLLQLKKAGEKFKSFMVSLLCIGLWSLFSMTVMAVYIYQSWDFYKFFLRMKG